MCAYTSIYMYMVYKDQGCICVHILVYTCIWCTRIKDVYVCIY